MSKTAVALLFLFIGLGAGFLLGLGATKAGAAFIEDFASSEAPADVAHAKSYARPALLQIPGQLEDRHRGRGPRRRSLPHSREPGLVHDDADRVRHGARSRGLGAGTGQRLRSQADQLAGAHARHDLGQVQRQRRAAEGQHPRHQPGQCASSRTQTKAQLRHRGAVLRRGHQGGAARLRSLSSSFDFAPEGAFRATRECAETPMVGPPPRAGGTR